jgi:hypothetical protein
MGSSGIVCPLWMSKGFRDRFVVDGGVVAWTMEGRGFRREVRGQMALDLPPELTRRSEWWEERQAERAVMRAEFKEARRHGLDARHATKLIRLERSWLTASDGTPAVAVMHGVPAGITSSRSAVFRRPQDAAGALPARPTGAGHIAGTPAPARAPAARAASRDTTARRHEPATDPAATTSQDRATPRPETATRTHPHGAGGRSGRRAIPVGMAGEVNTAAIDNGTTVEADTARKADTAAMDTDTAPEATTATDIDAGRGNRRRGGNRRDPQDARRGRHSHRRRRRHRGR